MTKRITLADVAVEAGVGVATVDRVLNARAFVRPKTAARVLAAAEALGYHGSGLLRRRLEELVPARSLGFVLQKSGKWFYRSLAEQIEYHAAGLKNFRAVVEFEFVERLSPDDLVGALNRLRSRVDAIAIVALNHPKVAKAVHECSEAGVPVFALLSRLDFTDIAGYVGIDGRKAGRTAGWAMARLAAGRGEVGVLIGSHRYLGHEDREVGFRAYVREHAPDLHLKESIVYLDDADLAHEAASKLLATSPGLVGLYQCGGGVAGTVRALVEACRASEVFFICHQKSPAAVNGLLDGVVDLVIANSVTRTAAGIVSAMEQALGERHSGRAHPARIDRLITFDLATAENV